MSMSYEELADRALDKADEDCAALRAENERVKEEYNETKGHLERVQWQLADIMDILVEIDILKERIAEVKAARRQQQEVLLAGNAE